jgi:serine/threonine protein kinase
MDLKPSNILVNFLPGPLFMNFDVKIGDLGSVAQADPRDRNPVDPKSLCTQGVQQQTLGFRAPEILFGDEAFGPAADPE